MTNKRFWFGMLIMVLAFGMTVVGCDKDSTDDGGNDWNGPTFDLTGVTFILLHPGDDTYGPEYEVTIQPAALAKL